MPLHSRAVGRPAPTVIIALYASLIPAVTWPLRHDVATGLAGLLAAGLALFGLWLLARGAAVAARYEAARVARRPRLPRKILGAICMALAALILAAQHSAQPLVPLTAATLALALALGAFGVDPLRHKGLNDPNELRRIADAALLTEFDTTLHEAMARVTALGDLDLAHRTHGACTMALQIVRATQSDPRGLEPLRGPLTTYATILGAAVLRLEEDWQGATHRFARRRFLAKLEVLNQAFEGRVRSGRLMQDADLVGLDADILHDRIVQGTAA